MEIYNEHMELIENPDLTIGYLKNDVRVIHHDAVEEVQEQWHYETIVTYPNGSKDVEKIIDVPGVQACDAWDEKVPIQVYVKYTKEELDEIEANKNKLTQEERITAIESKLDAFEVAYTTGVNEA